MDPNQNRQDNYTPSPLLKKWTGHKKNYLRKLYICSRLTKIGRKNYFWAIRAAEFVRPVHDFELTFFYTYFLKGEAKLQGSKCLRISSKSHFLEFTGHENINFGFKSLHWNTKNFSFYSGGRQVLIKFNFKTKLYCCGENLRVQHLSQSGISEFRSFAKMIILSKWGACQSCWLLVFLLFHFLSWKLKF